MSEKEQEIQRLMEQFGYNKFMIKEIMINYPEDYISILRAFEKTPLSTIRVNTLKIDPKELKMRLQKKGFILRESKWFPTAFHVDTSKSDFQIGATHEYLMGYYYIQDLASMVPAYILSPQPGDCVIDMCAAPGSKTTQIGEYMKQEGTIIAFDKKKSRLNSLISNINRCGIDNCVAIPHDSRKLRSLPKIKNWANKILLDAPCTGSGIIRKDSSRKTSRSIKDVRKMAEIQKDLLKEGLEILRPGGLLMYSTCSFHYRENEQVVTEVISSVKNASIIDPIIDNIGLPGLISAEGKDFGYDMLKTRRLYPNLHDCDAFFYCLIKKDEA